MKRFSRLPSFEVLEEKRLKAADLACSIAHGPGFVEAVEASPSCPPTSSPLIASSLQQSKSLTASAASESTEDESNSEEQGSETDGSDDNETDGSDDSEGDDTDDNETDGSDDNETDNSDDNESDDSDDSDSDDSDSDDSDSDDNDSSDQEMEFSATLTGTGDGTASVETDTEHASTKTDFVVKVSGAPASQTFQVTVDSTVVGNLTTDTQGAGKLKLSSDPDDDEQALPADFPTVSDGTTVSVGLAGQTPILTGTFAADSEASDLKQLESSGLSSGQLSLPNDFQTGGSGASSNSAALKSSATSLPSQRSADDSALDPNLVDLVYATADNPHNSEDQSALLESSTKGPADESADSVFERLSSNPLTWTN